MKDDRKKVETAIVNLDEARIKRLHKRGHMNSMLEEFETLRLKVIYDQDMTPVEVTRFITLLKYFMEHAPSESFKLSCKYMYERYVGPFGL